MSQASLVMPSVSPVPGLTLIQNMNAALMALATQNSGPFEPNPAYPFMTWMDTATGLFKIRDADNLSWLVLGVDQTDTRSTDFSIAVNDANKTFVVTPSANVIATLPAASAVPNGYTITILNANPALGVVSVRASGTADKIYHPGGLAGGDSQANVPAESSGALSMTLVSDGGAAWYRIAETSGHGWQLFTTSGTFTAPWGVTSVALTGIGGGGGGAGSFPYKGGGGGSGGRAIKHVVSVNPGAQYAVAIGAGGAGGAPASDGQPGGTTGFGSLLTLGGGAGGKYLYGGGEGGNGPIKGVDGGNGHAGSAGSGGLGGRGGLNANFLPMAGGANTGGGGGGAVTIVDGGDPGAAGGSGYLLVEW